MRQCPHTGCVCLMPLVGGLDLLCSQVVSFLRVCWQLPSWWGEWGWRWERLELDPGVRWDLLCAHWPSLAYLGWNRPQVAKAEAWMLGPELALLPLGCVSHSPILRPLVPERWRAAASGACENLGLGSAESDVSPRRGPGCVPPAACAGCGNGSPSSAQTDSSVSPPCPSQRPLPQPSRSPPPTHVATSQGHGAHVDSACIRGRAE